jgi:glycosyltransferase involved in cell wall biosynthesis
VETPAVHTDHVPTGGDVRECYARYPGTRLVALSRYHRSKFEGLKNIPVIYNGVDVESFPFNPEAGDYLVFLGHMIERKGPVEAIRAARKAGMPLVLAGPRPDEAYFEAEVAPLVDGRLVEYVGPVSAAERNELLSGAGALLFTSLFSEPFGLVMVEAMVCGTPVAALERCAVPEVVDRDATGFYARDADALAAIIPRTVALDRHRVRRQATRRFDYRRMAAEYEALYRRMAGRPAGGEALWVS